MFWINGAGLSNGMTLCHIMTLHLADFCVRKWSLFQRPPNLWNFSFEIIRICRKNILTISRQAYFNWGVHSYLPTSVSEETTVYGERDAAYICTRVLERLLKVLRAACKTQSKFHTFQF